MLGAIALAVGLSGGKHPWFVALLSAGSIAAATLVLLSEIRSGAPRLPRLALAGFVGVAIAASIPALFVARDVHASRLEWVRWVTLVPFAVLALRAFGATPSTFFRGLAAICAAEALVGFLLPGESTDGRMRGTMPNPTLFAELMAIGCAAAAGSWLEDRIGGRRGADGRALRMAGVGAICLAAGLSSASRVFPLALGAGFAVLAFRYASAGRSLSPLRSSLAAALVATAVVGAVTLVPSPLRSRTAGLERADPFSNLRPQIWAATLSMAREYPAGVGWGNFASEWPPFAFPVEGAVARNGMAANFAHNEYLHVLAEGGVAAAAGLLLLLVAIGRALPRALLDRARPASGTAAAVVAATLAGGLVDFNWHPPALALPAAISLAFLLFAGEAEVPWLARLAAKLGSRLGVYVALGGAAGSVAVALPALSYALHARADAAARTGDVEGALSNLRLCALVSPSWGMPWLSIGSLRHERFRLSGDVEDAESAVRAYREAAACRPADGEPWRRLAVLYGDRALRGADVAERSARWAAAREAVAEAIRRDPFDAFHFAQLGALSLAGGDRHAALVAYEKAIALEPNFAAAHDALTSLLRDASPAQAKAHADAAFRAAAKSDRATTPFEKALVARAPGGRGRALRYEEIPTGGTGRIEESQRP